MDSENGPPADPSRVALVSRDWTQGDRHIPDGARFLARGGAADVWLPGVLDIYGREYVLKAIRVSLESLRESCNPKSSKGAERLWADFISAFRSKVERWKVLQHTHVLGLFDLHAELVIRMEFCANGTAAQYLGQHLDDHINRRKSMISEVVAGINYLHLQDPPVIHGCICMDKLFVDSHGRTKIGEFGLSNMVEQFGLFAPSVSQVSRTRWLSPELLDTDAEEYNPTPTVASDVWALGCTLFEIMSGKLPYFKFKHDLRVQKEILSKKLAGRPNSCLAAEFSDCWPILVQCWSWIPEQRPTVDVLVRSDLLTMGKDAEDAEMDYNELVLDGIPEEYPRHSAGHDQSPPQKRRKLVKDSSFVLGEPSSQKSVSQVRVNDTQIDASRALVSSKHISLPPFNPSDIQPLQLLHRVSNSDWEPTTSSLQQLVTHPSGASRIRKLAAVNRESAVHTKTGASIRRCERCKQHGMECTFDTPGVFSCQECQSNGQDCVPEDPEPREFALTTPSSSTHPRSDNLFGARENETRDVSATIRKEDPLGGERIELRACQNCNQLRRKCIYSPGSTKCQTCQKDGRQCVSARTGPENSRELPEKITDLREDEKTSKKNASTRACKICRHFKIKCQFDPPGSTKCQRCSVGGSLEQLAVLNDDKQEIIDRLLRIISSSGAGGLTGVEATEVRYWTERAVRSLVSSQESGEISRRNEVERPPPYPTPVSLSAHLSRNTYGNEDKPTKGISGSKSQVEEDEEDEEDEDEEETKSQVEEDEEDEEDEEEEEDEGGVTNAGEGDVIPKILTLKIITDAEVERLFRIFREKIDPAIAIVDPVIHTVSNLKARCPFLFTVICAIASQYWIKRPELYTILMRHAKAAAAATITDRYKSLEICQGYLLLSFYPPPARTWAEDRRWLYLGCAIRMAMDLELDKQGSMAYMNEAHERESLNMTRTWLICVSMDRTLTTRLGRPTTILDDHIVRHSQEWWRHSKYNRRLDVHLCYYTQLFQIVTRYFNQIYSNPDSVSGFNESTDFGSITCAFDDEVENFMQDMTHAHATSSEPAHPSCRYRLAQIRSVLAYYRLMMHSFGLENSVKLSPQVGTTFLSSSIDAASEVIRITNEDLPIYEFHRYSPDDYWLWSVYAAMFLIKLMKPRSTQPPHFTLTRLQRETTISLLERFIHTLRTSALDDQHTPALYARSLAHLLDKSTLSGVGEMGYPDVDILASADLGNRWPDFPTNEPAHKFGREDFWDNLLLPGTWGMSTPPT
ncbi:unnamed protein product [Rhizoctonia solani]|uniref:Protein kinase domain-containing protein n=1 Tax=Rhizoctonia solani TaxID=456999 RepID=A0A8H3B0Q3_9AGAM|nr:unnamed protein product [Rhizoctonia solani]